MVNIREIREDDAAEFLELCRTLDAETPFFLYEPGERNHNAEEQRRRIADLLKRPTAMTFVAEQDGELVGYLEAAGPSLKKKSHAVSIGIGVLQRSAGQGIGKRLFAALEDWAQQNGIRRIELTAMEHNEVGLGLYRKIGYEVEGIKRDAVLIDGRCINSILMSKLI
jgi:RimJ/RimL family protein N-acetyltransferase